MASIRAIAGPKPSLGKERTANVAVLYLDVGGSGIGGLGRTSRDSDAIAPGLSIACWV